LFLGRGKFEKRVIEKNIVYGCALYQIIKAVGVKKWHKSDMHTGKLRQKYKCMYCRYITLLLTR
jgi:hypothetical protein